jgi:hypothetical protein
MGTHPFGYIAIIVVQQLVIVGLFFGISRLLQELDRLRGGARIRTALKNADPSLAGCEAAGPEFPELRSKPAPELARGRAEENDARILANVRS